MTTRVRLADVAQARSGDKGDLANVALFAPSDALYDAFVREVTTERVRSLFGRFVKGEVDRYEVPNVRALNFVLHQALDGGAARSLRSDPLGKSYGSLLLRLEIDLRDGELPARSAAEPPAGGGQSLRP
ncbi:MAG: AtuA-related protein [Candidatus Dormibacteria bacterium]